MLRGSKPFPIGSGSELCKLSPELLLHANTPFYPHTRPPCGYVYCRGGVGGETGGHLCSPNTHITHTALTRCVPFLSWRSLATCTTSPLLLISKLGLTLVPVLMGLKAAAIINNANYCSRSGCKSTVVFSFSLSLSLLKYYIRLLISLCQCV